MQTLFSVAVSLILGLACGHYAKRRGRGPIPWLVMGGLFGIFALIALFILPNLKKQKTSKKPTVVEPTKLTATFPLHAEKLWYYLDDEKKQMGPMSFSGLSKAWDEGVVREVTLVWNEGMQNWQHLKEVAKWQ